jgi:hypothetical protein
MYLPEFSFIIPKLLEKDKKVNDFLTGYFIGQRHFLQRISA